MSGTRQSKTVHRLFDLGVTVAVVAAAYLIRQGLDVRFGIVLPAFFTFYPAIMVVAVIYGLWPGLLATALSALLIDYFILKPLGFGIVSA